VIRKAALYAWAGAQYVWTLLTVVALFYFPVFLDTTAQRAGPAHAPPWASVALAAGVGPLVVVLIRARADRPLAAAAVNAWLWETFMSWQPTGRVVWDLGFGPARLVYLIYWVAAGLSGYGLSLRDGGLGYLSGAGVILERVRGVEPRRGQLVRRSLYLYSRHPFATYLVLSLWLTPLLTLDRLIWAALGSIHALAIAQTEERALQRAFGGDYEAYRSRVPKWLPFRYKGG
jgi:protein-S-isoprenylcysteine O-methyltransferase Ste14